MIALALVAAIGWLDYSIGPQIMLNALYLIPVLVVAWASASTAYGLAVALATVLVAPIEAALQGFDKYSLPASLWNAGGRLCIFVFVLYLLHNQRLLTAQQHELALRDELTGVANRRAFREAATHELERSRRYRHQLSVAYIDIDHFKAVNDSFGHSEGDRVLQTLASVATTVARSVDTVARIGGDEFVILMPETGPRSALPVVNRLLDALPSPATEQEQATVTCSVGLATFKTAPPSVEALLAAADGLMYEAKAEGGDRVRHAVIAEQPAAGEKNRSAPHPSVTPV
jgi:diguanylate cyclase (GGDEF)-like protein